jgi:hypothetical protein
LSIIIYKGGRFGVSAHPKLGSGFMGRVLLSEKFRYCGWGAPGIILYGIFKQFDGSHFVVPSCLAKFLQKINVFPQMDDIRN